ncbi:winged helix-turn-helix domain-containing protein [Burkholderia lata]|uniref:winged helix-turn-helix domain-containing protein n=1 Tax=Burkholderia lata (strain ATCC 17760 / DSM 23089 / LMG 22485 / NCIMB 9086 / R18194 / 383) TaxID=482957 RepID=UPI001582E0B2|nr:winged helix-turn-helix domain-containing protein [Burkholderia lata]
MNAENSPTTAAPTTTSRVGAAGVMCYPGFEVDIDRGELRVDGRAVALRPKTLAPLTYLTQRPGRLLVRDALLEAVWRDVIVTDDSLVQCISELRSALGNQRQRVIRTVPRRGYMLDLQPITPAVPRKAEARFFAQWSGCNFTSIGPKPLTYKARHLDFRLKSKKSQL